MTPHTGFCYKAQSTAAAHSELWMTHPTTDEEQSPFVCPCMPADLPPFVCPGRAADVYLITTWMYAWTGVKQQNSSILSIFA